MLLESLIKDLDAAEIRDAEHWLRSPLHNQREDLLDLFRVLAESKKESEEEISVWQSIKPTEAYDGQKLRLLKSYLLKRLEEWLAFVEWQRAQSLPGGPYLTRAYRRRGLEKPLSNRIVRRQKALVKQSMAGLDALQLAYELEEQALDIAIRKKRTEAHNLPALKLSGLALVIGTQLRAACRTLSFGQINEANEDLQYLQAGIDASRRNHLAQKPGIQLFYLACLTLLNPENEENYLSFEQVLFAKLDHHPADEQKELLLIALNRCVRKINAGSALDMERALQLYRLGLGKELLYRQGKLSNFTFSNIVGIALRLKAFDFVADFLGTHRFKLPPENGQEVFALNAARYAYAIGALENALVYLREADYQDLIHHLNARTLLAKIYFELDYFNLLDSHLKNTRAILRRKKGQSYHLQNYRNFFQSLQKIQRLPAKKPATAERLCREINELQPLIEKTWLLKCLDFQPIE